MLHKILIPFLFAPATFADVSCYNYGTITNCTNGVTAYQYGSTITSIHAPDQQPITAYRYGNITKIEALEVRTPSQILPVPLGTSVHDSLMLEPIH